MDVKISVIIPVSDVAVVLPYIHCVTSKNDRILYDAERKEVFSEKW